MPKNREYVARGASGLKGRPRITKEVLALRDKAKREKDREITVADNQKRQKQGKRARTTAQRKGKVSESTRLLTKASELNKKATAATEGKVGTKEQRTKVAKTYRKAARVAIERAKAARKVTQEKLHQKTEELRSRRKG